MILDTLRRYFVANPAPIIAARYTGINCRFVWTNCGNAGGFMWGNWQVMWRRPYAKVWAFDGKRWVHAYELTTRSRPDAE